MSGFDLGGLEVGGDGEHISRFEATNIFLEPMASTAQCKRPWKRGCKQTPLPLQLNFSGQEGDKRFEGCQNPLFITNFHIPIPLYRPHGSVKEKNKQEHTIVWKGLSIFILGLLQQIFTFTTLYKHKRYEFHLWNKYKYAKTDGRNKSVSAT